MKTSSLFYFLLLLLMMYTFSCGRNKTAHKEMISTCVALCSTNESEIAYTPNTEEYSSFNENSFLSPVSNPLSTFSIDVDGASYSNIRRMINNGELPPTDAVRVEECINYFSYDYPQPDSNDPVKIVTEVGTCPWAVNHRLVKIGLKAKEISTDNLPSSNFVFLIDVSGSMDAPNKLGLVKASLKLLLNNMREKDKISIVTYAGAERLALPCTSAKNKEKILEVLNDLEAAGSTAGEAGIKLAYKTAKDHFIKNGNNRIILCTDGDFNVGVSSEGELEKLIEKERKNDIFLTVLGYGMGNYKDNKMQILAEKGSGNAAYIDNLQEANKVLVNEFGSTMYAVARDVKLQIEFNPDKVQYYRLIGYETRLLKDEDFNNDSIDAGEMGAGHTVTALYEIIPVGLKTNLKKDVDELKYQPKAGDEIRKQGTHLSDLMTVKLRYKELKNDKSKKIDQVVIDNGNNQVSSDFHFISAVAMFGQLLRDSQYKGESSYSDVITLAQKGLDNDTHGYRREFIRIAETVKGMTTTKNKK